MQIIALASVGEAFAGLRSKRSMGPGPVSPGPIRVLADPDHPGRFEVVDGFKRTRDARELAAVEIVVLVEPAAPHLTLAQHAAVLILASNAPRRTLTPMDEVRVVADLVDERGMTPLQVAKVLGHSKAWVSKRLKVARRLAVELCRRLDAGALRLTVAYQLAELPRGDQIRLADGMGQLGLGVRESLQVMEAYKATEGAEREELLADPWKLIDDLRSQGESADPLGLRPSVRDRVQASQRLRQQLEELVAAPPLVGLTDPEQRLLEGERRRLVAALKEAAGALSPDETEPTTEQKPVVPPAPVATPPTATAAVSPPSTPSDPPLTQENTHEQPQRRHPHRDPAPVGGRPGQEGDRPSPRDRRQARPPDDPGCRPRQPARA